MIRRNFLTSMFALLPAGFIKIKQQEEEMVYIKNTNQDILGVIDGTVRYKKIKSYNYVTEIWFNNEGAVHRDCGPAELVGLIDSKFHRLHKVHKVQETYYKNGFPHRDGDQPAEISYNSDGSISIEKYCKDGLLHRENGPAWIDDGQNFRGWWINGKCIKELRDGKCSEV